MCAPAIINAFIVARGGARAFPYDTYSAPARTIVMIIFVAAQAPELVSGDLRHRVLPLYFARPLRRADYLVAKFTAFAAACLIMIEVPLLLLYAGTIASAHGGAAVWAKTRALLPGLAIGLMWSVTLAVTGLAIASFSGWRAYATGAAATVATMVFAGVPELIAGLIATRGATPLAIGLSAGALAGSVIYNAVFVCLSAATTRALALGLFYALLWEGALANFVGGARVLSAGHYALALANTVAP